MCLDLKLPISSEPFEYDQKQQQQKQTATIATSIWLRLKYGSKWAVTNTSTFTLYVLSRMWKEKRSYLFSNEWSCSYMSTIIHTRTRIHIPIRTRTHSYTQIHWNHRVQSASSGGTKIDHNIVWFLIKNHFQSWTNFEVMISTVIIHKICFVRVDIVAFHILILFKVRVIWPFIFETKILRVKIS